MRNQLLMTLLAVCFSLSAYAQQLVKGTVMEGDTGEGLIGANVVIKGTTIGTVTDFEGGYTLEVPNGDAILVYSFVGMQEQEVLVGNQTQIDITLGADAEQLDDVVIVGYTKKDEASPVQTIGVVTDIVTPNVTNALQGKATGVSVSTSTGQPGAKNNIRIRGVGSITASTDPLYVIDGVIINTDDMVQANQQAQRDPMSNINPDDIEDVKVLKDAAATALYGSRAANGVILITTKRGAVGKTQFSASVQEGVSVVNYGNMDMMDLNQYRDYRTAMAGGVEYDPAGWDGNSYDWFDLAFQPGRTSNYQLSAQGGNDKTKFFASVGYFNQEGIVKGSDFERFSMRMNVDNQVNDRVSFTLGTDLSYITQNNASNGNLYSSPLMAGYMQIPFVSPYDASGNLRPILDASSGVTGQGSTANFLYDLNHNYRRMNSLNGGLMGRLNVDIYEGLSFSSTNSARFEYVNNRYFVDGTTYDGSATNGSLNNTDAFNMTLTSTNTFNYETSFGLHNLNVLAGWEAQSNDRSVTGAYGENLPSGIEAPDGIAMNQGITGWLEQYRFLSMLSQVQYNYDNKYFASVSYRRDGSSRFAPENRWGNFWSVAGAWDIAKEDFMASTKFDQLKLRASVGTTGNANLGIGLNPLSRDYAYRPLYAFNQYNGNPAAYWTQLGNEDLTWEKRLKSSIGVDFGFNGWLSGGLDFYHETSSDLLMQTPVSATTGFVTQTANVGEMVNKGVELNFTTQNMQRDDFTWSTSVNLTHNVNEVTRLYGGQDILVGAVNIVREGLPVNSFYLPEYAGANPNNGQSSWFVNDPSVTPENMGENMYVDPRTGRVATTSYGEAEYTDLGDPYPWLQGAITNDLRYRQFDLSFMFTFSVGGSIYNSTGRFVDSDNRTSNQHVRAMEDRWTQPGDIAYRPALNDVAGANHSSRYLENGSYLSLRNITLGYNLPNHIVENWRVGGVRFFVQAQNLFTISSYSGFTPITAGGDGINFFEYPEGRIFTGGVTVKF
ncbi:TonB-dependent receptor [Persicobacter diffluens]|uniref:SusC/RagA family TonB-linked outer membrane protein n=1 Tax=Persicobacter diffluens TaxID=981 RepID=A0AAN4W100_9BACT|nr:SusC/RagA family TonB-linked outer membrane protein [Persicobacter diffluens]